MFITLKQTGCVFVLFVVEEYRVECFGFAYFEVECFGKVWLVVFNEKLRFFTKSLITKGKWNDDTTTTHRDKQLDTETSDETTQNYWLCWRHPSCRSRWPRGKDWGECPSLTQVCCRVSHLPRNEYRREKPVVLCERFHGHLQTDFRKSDSQHQRARHGLKDSHETCTRVGGVQFRESDSVCARMCQYNLRVIVNLGRWRDIKSRTMERRRKRQRRRKRVVNNDANRLKRIVSARREFPKRTREIRVQILLQGTWAKIL